jgi:hypothetical protein
VAETDAGAGASAGGTVEVVENVDGRYYEIRVDGEFAGIVVYESFGSRRVLTHTFIENGFRGRGLSWRLMSGVLDDLRARHLTATNHCPVLDRFFQANPQYADLLDVDHPGAWPDRRPVSA